MPPKKPLQATDKPLYRPNGTTKTAKALNAGLVVSTALLEVGQLASIVGLQHAAVAASAVISTIDVCGWNMERFFDFCIEIRSFLFFRESNPTKKTSRSSLMMPRNLSLPSGAYKKNPKTRRSGYPLRLGIWLQISKSNVVGHVSQVSAYRRIRTLDEVNKYARRQTKRNMMTRIVFNMTDAAKIRQSREKISMAVERFQVYFLNFIFYFYT